MADPTDADFRRIVETAVNPFLLFDASGTVVWVGESVAELADLPLSAFVGRSIFDFLTPEGKDLASDALATADERVQAGAPTAWEGGAPQIDIVLPDGRVLPCAMAIATPARTGLRHYVVQLRRSGGLSQLHDALAAMAEGRDVDEVLEHLRAMAELDLPFTRLTLLSAWNGVGFERVIGDAVSLPGAAFDGSDSALPWFDATHEPHVVATDDLPPDLARAAAAIGATSCWVRVVRLARPVPARAAVIGWHVVPWRMTAFTEAALERLTRFVQLALQWATDREALEWAASHDQLTGLRNRGAFFDDLRSLATPSDDRTDGRVGVLYLDLDGFKPVNDELGHGFGDTVLAIVAERLRRCVRTEDTVARLGGDEFAVLCPDVGDGSVAEALAERMIDAVSKPISVGGHTVHLGLSVGMAIRDDLRDADEVLDAADTALREVKETGKGAWRRG